MDFLQQQQKINMEDKSTDRWDLFYSWQCKSSKEFLCLNEEKKDFLSTQDWEISFRKLEFVNHDDGYHEFWDFHFALQHPSLTPKMFSTWYFCISMMPVSSEVQMDTSFTGIVSMSVSLSLSKRNRMSMGKMRSMMQRENWSDYYRVHGSWHLESQGYHAEAGVSMEGNSSLWNGDNSP